MGRFLTNMKMNKRLLIKLSFAINVLLFFAIIIVAYKYYPRIIKKLDPNTISKLSEKGFERENMDSSSVFSDASMFTVIGKVPQTDLYSRLPQSAEGNVRPPVWNFSQNSAGVSIRFTSNSTSIKIRWTLKNNITMSKMTFVASKGFDLYVRENNKWQFVGIAEPKNAIHNEATIIEGMKTGAKEYLLNLPLYDGVSLVEIGVDHDAFIRKPDDSIIDKQNPILFYGTSITQGASASRPGLTYCALMQRALNKEVINLGFSGNGRFEKEIAQYFMASEPSLIVLDCTPNSHADTIRQNLPELVDYIRSVDKEVPILFIESIMRDFAYFKVDNKDEFGTLSFINEQNDALQEVYADKMKKYENLYYVDSKELIGTDHEATIDGTHFNDLGHYRAYVSLKQEIEKILTHNLLVRNGKQDGKYQSL